MSRATLLVDSPASAPAAPAEADRTYRRSVDPHLASLVTPGSFEAAQYRRLRMAIEHLGEARGVRVVAFSSASPSEGKTLTAVNTAGALSQTSDLKILLIDADLRRPSVHRYLGWPHQARPGLSDYVSDPRLALSDIVHRDPPFECDVMLTGSAGAGTPYETLQSPRLQRLFAEARERYDYVLIDTPPLLAVPDCHMLAEHVDGLLLVVRAHKTSKRHLADVLRDREALKIVGLIFNADDDCGRGYDNSYYR